MQFIQMFFRSFLFPCDAFEMQTFASFSGFFCVFRLFNLWGGQSFYPPLQRCSKSRALQQYIRAFQLVNFRIVLGSIADGISLLSCRNSCFLSWSTDREGGRWNTKANATHSLFQRTLKIENLRGACAVTFDPRYRSSSITRCRPLSEDLNTNSI